jgi:hypothetical protein
MPTSLNDNPRGALAKKQRLPTASSHQQPQAGETSSSGKT